MLSASIYEATKLDIQDLTNKHTQQLVKRVTNLTQIQPAVRTGYTIANEYHGELVPLIFRRLTEVSKNAVEHYAPDLVQGQKEYFANNAMDQLVHNKYYGLTLPQRLKQSNITLRYNLRRSAAVGAKLETKLLNITRVFNETYPFGAHKNWDTRLFLAEAVRLEHIIARDIGVHKDHKLVRWTLSKRHSQEDVCDQLARAVDNKVKSYMEQNNYKTDPHGVYFLKDVPAIPHPNCQCVIRYITEKKKRTVPTSPPKSLIRRILDRIFGRK